MDFRIAAVDLWESIEEVDFTGGSVVKNLPANAGDQEGLNPCVGKILRRRKWLPTPVFLPKKSHDRGVWWAIVHGIEKMLDMT